VRAVESYFFGSFGGGVI